MLKFSDGVEIDTSGELRKLTLKDGMYVVGQGLLIPVKDEVEAETIISKLQSNTPTPTQPVKESRILRLDEFDSTASPVLGQPISNESVKMLLEVLEDNEDVITFKTSQSYSEENVKGFIKKGQIFLVIEGDPERNVITVTPQVSLSGKNAGFTSTQSTVN